MERVESMKDGECGMTVSCMLTKNVMSVLTLGSSNLDRRNTDT